VSIQQLRLTDRSFVSTASRGVTVAEPIRLRQLGGGPSGLLLDIFHAFTVVEVPGNPLSRRWRTTTLMYEYRVLDHHHRELLVYHWQPGSSYLGPDHPHLHVSASLRSQVNAHDTREIGLDRLHLPTGRVTFEAVIRMLVTDFGIAPRRNDWQATLDQAETMFHEHRGH
jgi:hypothetical protein